jgi:hypothetical protein
MIIDSRLELCDATALNTGAAGTYLLGNQPNLGLAPGDIGEGEDLYLVLTVDTTCTSAGSATASFSLASDDTASVSATTSTVHFTTPVYPVASLVAGFQRAFCLPKGIVYEQYLGLLQTTAVAAFTAGKINAFITRDPPGLRSYPDGVN